MPSEETAAYLTSKLEGLISLRNDARRCVGDARTFYEAQITQLREIEAGIALVRSWLQESEAEPGALEARTNSEAPPKRKETVKALIRSTLPSLGEEFTASELVDILSSIDPTIMRNTVMVELHYFTKRGELQRISTGHYRNIGVHMPVLMDTA